MPVQTIAIAARACFGAVQLLAPVKLLRLIAGRAPTTLELFATRVLGTRQLLEAAILAEAKRPEMRRLGAGVDGLHALTMILLAARRPRERRLAIASGSSALVLGAAALVGSSR